MRKERSRLLLLAHLAQFSLCRRLPGGQPFAGLRDMAFTFVEDGVGDVRVGDLVALQSAPPTKWYLSWVHDARRGAGGYDATYVLESIEDGELCNWSNVGLLRYSREEVEGHPEWRWTEAQHAFNARWLRQGRWSHRKVAMKVCFNGAGDGAVLRARIPYTDETRAVAVEDWRRVRLKELRAVWGGLEERS